MSDLSGFILVLDPFFCPCNIFSILLAHGSKRVTCVNIFSMFKLHNVSYVCLVVVLVHGDSDTSIGEATRLEGGG